MKHIFYEKWYKKRVKKIIDIFGEDWFPSRKVLELGACHGDIGSELLKLGAEVSFTDARPEHLETIKDRFKDYDYIPMTGMVNQNFDYAFDRHFDLILHFGTLSHVENWKNDLFTAMKHTNCMLLDTPINGAEDSFRDAEDYKYDGFQCREPLFTQESVEKTLADIGCKFLRLDTNTLNADWSWVRNGELLRHVYDWDYTNYESYRKGEHQVQFRRFWIVLK
jgi:2-polyprenyl-3-methyl-5-hydroxy-6-metoxy-1,4-benzoquinol methylase